jgi:hypothetical protein
MFAKKNEALSGHSCRTGIRFFTIPLRSHSHPNKSIARCYFLHHFAH